MNTVLSFQAYKTILLTLKTTKKSLIWNTQLIILNENKNAQKRSCFTSKNKNKYLLYLARRNDWTINHRHVLSFLYSLVCGDCHLKTQSRVEWQIYDCMIAVVRIYALLDRDNAHVCDGVHSSTNICLICINFRHKIIKLKRLLMGDSLSILT